MEDLAPGLTTMIGSMPQTSAADALAMLERFPLSIPSWPQLPKRSFDEWFLPQYTEGFPGLRVDRERRTVGVDLGEGILEAMTAAYEAVLSDDCDAFAMSADCARGLHAFLERQAGRDLPAAKGHMTGPLTFGLSLNDQTGKPVWWDPQYRDLVVKGLGLKGLWQVRQLQRCARRVLLFFDEPLLSALGTAAYIGIGDEDVVDVLNEVTEPARSAGALTGAHCCANMDGPLLMRTRLDILAFDAYGFGDRVALYAQEAEAFLRRGGYLAWGIVPTIDPALAERETADSLRRRRDGLISQFTAKGADESLLRARILYTPSCGMGTLEPRAAENVLRLLRELPEA